MIKKNEKLIIYKLVKKLNLKLVENLFENLFWIKILNTQLESNGIIPIT